MALLDPTPPQTQDPDWIRQSHEVKPPSPIPVIENKSVGQALTSLGAGLDSAVNLVDTAIKKGVEKEAYRSVDPLRDQFTAGLEKIKSNLDQGIIPAPVQGAAGTTTGKSLLDAHAEDTKQDVPPIVSGGLDRIDQLAQAKAAGSVKLNDTQYAKDVLSEAKRIRAQVPEGYRSYVDEQISKASGLPVANSYYQNMLQDINHQLAQIGKTKDDLKTMMERNSSVPGMKQWYQQYLSGNKTITQPFIFSKINDWENLQAQQKIDAAGRAAGDADLTTKQRDKEASLIKNLNRTMDYFTGDKLSIASMSGLGEQMGFVRDLQAGLHPEVGDAEVKQRQYNLQAYRQGIYEMMKKDSREHADVIGNDKVEKNILNTLAPLDNLITLFNDKSGSPATFHQNQIEAIKADDVHGWMASKDKGAISRQIMAGRTIFGEQYFPTWIGNILSRPGPDGKPLDKPIQDVFNQEAMSAISPLTDKRGQPVPRYMKDAIQHGKEVDLNQLPSYVGKVTSLIGSIADPKMPLQAKDKLIDWAYNPKNAGIFDELKMDYIDPNTHEKIPGKYRAFNILSAPAMTNAVRETALIHPDNYAKYRSHMEQEFGGLYKQTIKDLNNLVGSGVGYSWNERTNQLGLVDSKNRPIDFNSEIKLGNIPLMTQAYMKWFSISDKLKDLNEGIGHMAVIHKNDPRSGQEADTGKYLFQVLQTMRFSGGDVSGGPSNTILNIQRAMMKSRSPELTNEQLDKALLGNK